MEEGEKKKQFIVTKIMLAAYLCFGTNCFNYSKEEKNKDVYGNKTTNNCELMIKVYSENMERYTEDSNG